MLWLCHECWYPCRMREKLRSCSRHRPLYEFGALPERKLHDVLREYGLPVLHAVKRVELGGLLG